MVRRRASRGGQKPLQYGLVYPRIQDLFIDRDRRVLHRVKPLDLQYLLAVQHCARECLTSCIIANTITCMRIEFDPAKNAANIAKHGLSLGDAALVNWDDALIWENGRVDYGEVRTCALGYIGTRLCFIAFVNRGHVRRVISLRKANKREFKDYVRDIEKR